jgi:threonine synthase
MAFDVKYVSTSGAASADFVDALFRGQAPDGGLFVPTALPLFDIEAWVGADYNQMAQAVLKPFADVDADYDFEPRFEETLRDDRALMRLDTGPVSYTHLRAHET